MNIIFDYDDGDFIIKTGRNIGMDCDGDIMIRMGDNMGMDLESGEIHYVSSWDDEN